MTCLAGSFVKVLGECGGLKEEPCLMLVVPCFTLDSILNPKNERGSHLGCFCEFKGLP